MPYTIKINCNNDEGEQFAAWLNKQGHDAKVGHETADEVDGVSSFSDPLVSEIMDGLWSDYCNS